MHFDQTPPTPTNTDAPDAPINPDSPVGTCPADADILQTYLTYLEGISTNQILTGSNPDEEAITMNLQQAVTLCRVGHTRLARLALSDAEHALETSPRAHKLEPYKKVLDGVHEYLNSTQQTSSLQ